MVWRLVASSSACQSSRFFTGFLSAVFHPLRFQPWIQLCTPFFTYWLSVWISTLQGRFSAFSASMAAVSSILLLVVSASRPSVARRPPLLFGGGPPPPALALLGGPAIFEDGSPAAGPGIARTGAVGV